MIPRRPRLLIIVLVVVLLGAAGGISAIRRPILRPAGWALVVNERVEPADVVVLAYSADFAGMLEAADLVHGGVATESRFSMTLRTPWPSSSSGTASPTKMLHDLFDNSRRSVSTLSSKSQEMHAELRT